MSLARLSLLSLLLSCTEPKPKTVSVPMENTSLSCSPENAKLISLLYSTELKNKNAFVKAASAVVLKDSHFYIIQDSSRYLAEVPEDLSAITMHALASKEVMSDLEDPKKP